MVSSAGRRGLFVQDARPVSILQRAANVQYRRTLDGPCSTRCSRPSVGAQRSVRAQVLVGGRLKFVEVATEANRARQLLEELGLDLAAPTVARARSPTDDFDPPPPDDW
jgi:hypothetical protein